MVEVPWSKIVLLSEVEPEKIQEFNCGEQALDDWLHHSASNAVARYECAVHVCVTREGDPMPFFTLTSTSLQPCDVTSDFRGGLSSFLPSILLGKMGVDVRLHGRGYGTLLLEHAKKFAYESSLKSAARVLVLDALNADLIPWYEKRGFRKLPASELRMVCKMSKIASLCSNAPEGYFVI